MLIHSSFLRKFFIICFYCAMIGLPSVTGLNDTLKDSAEEPSEKVVSRKRRYITFPEGASLQLAFDQTIPIAAAQLLFTVGITVAMAFELPSKPLYHITQELREQINGKKEETEEASDAPATDMPDDDNTIGVMDNSSRTDYNYKNLFYSNRNNNFNSINKHNMYYSNSYQPNGMIYKQSQTSVNNPSYYGKYPNYVNNYYGYENAPNGYLDRNDQFGSQYASSTAKPKTTKAPRNQTKADWGSIVNSFMYELTKSKKIKKVDIKKLKDKEPGNIFLRKNHRVFPVFGRKKRNSEDDDNVDLTSEEKFYLEHHRDTRFSLYSKIEGWLKGRGKNGKACVLRALCETNQQNQNDVKGSFLVEIMRAIFSLPDQMQPYKQEHHEIYDKAHNSIGKDCSESFAQCHDSIWAPDFAF